jgi:hypothetical protein
MVRWVIKIVMLGLFIVAGSVGIHLYQKRYSVEQQLERAQEETRVLTRVVQRLSDEKRVADVLVTDQKTVNGQLHTWLLFVEYDKSGESLPPRSVEVVGRTAHIDAMVIKFERDFIKQGDPLRGHSIALFTRIYGDAQSPESGTPVDEPGKIPEIYRGSDPKVPEFEQELWQKFWTLAGSAEERAKYGVRVANGQGVWGPFEKDKLYSITLESDGGLNITSEPLRGIYREALRQHASTTQAVQ